MSPPPSRPHPTQHQFRPSLPPPTSVVTSPTDLSKLGATVVSKQNGSVNNVVLSQQSPIVVSMPDGAPTSMTGGLHYISGNGTPGAGLVTSLPGAIKVARSKASAAAILTSSVPVSPLPVTSFAASAGLALPVPIGSVGGLPASGTITLPVNVPTGAPTSLTLMSVAGNGTGSSNGSQEPEAKRIRLDPALAN